MGRGERLTLICEPCLFDRGGEDNLSEGSLKRMRHEVSPNGGPGSNGFAAAAAARRDSGIEILD